MTDVTLEEELLEVLAVLESAGVPNALCGGIAANLYRAGVRATDDVDVYIICSAPELVSLARLFEEAGWQAHPAWRQAELLRLLRDGHPPTDLLIASTDFERRAIEHATSFQIGATVIRVLLPEDLIVFKLVAGRHHDYESVAAIIYEQGAKLDLGFIERTLAEIGMEDRLTTARDAAARMDQDAR